MNVRALTVFLSLLLLAPTANAHEGKSVEIEAGDYVVDIGIEELGGTASPGEVSFDFNLLTATNEKPVSFTAVEVTIENEGTIEFRGALHKPEFGTPTLRYFFRGGNYTMQTIFLNGYEEIVSTEFPVELPDESENPVEFRNGLLIALVVLLTSTGGYLIYRGRSQSVVQ